MNSVNSVSISGHLGREPELRATASGSSVLNFPIAVTSSRKVNGEYVDKVSWVDCCVFGRRADALKKFLAKGMMVFIHGRLIQSMWERDGQKRYRLEVIVDEIVVATTRGDGKGSPAAPGREVPAYQTAQQDYDTYDEDIPF